MKKLKDNSGETLVESLVSIVVVLLTFLFMTAAVIAAAKINSRVKEADVDFNYDGVLQADGFVNVWLDKNQPLESRQGWSLDVDKYVTDNGYIYYNRRGGTQTADNRGD